MSVVGFYDKQVIEASYELSKQSITIGLVVIAISGLFVATFGGRIKSLLFLAWGAAVIGSVSIVSLVQILADSLCFEAPLNVKAQGLMMAPFLLGTTGSGLITLLFLFTATNVLAVCFSEANRVYCILIANLFLSLCLGLAAFAAYMGASMGYGIPLLAKTRFNEKSFSNFAFDYSHSFDFNNLVLEGSSIRKPVDQSKDLTSPQHGSPLFTHNSGGVHFVKRAEHPVFELFESNTIHFSRI